MGSRPRVLFLAAHGRSGTTLLGQMLGELSGFTFTGEVLNAFSVPQGHLCGCGETLDRCPFWSSVLASSGGTDRSREAARFRLTLGRHTLPLLVSALRTGKLRREIAVYSQAIGDLYRSMHDAASGGVIVDSSKEPLHALILAQQAGIDVTMLHVVRDPRGAAFSWQRTKRKPDVVDQELYMPRFSPVRSAVAWLGRNTVIELAAKRLPTARVRYEDVMRDGPVALRAPLAAAGCDPGPLGATHHVFFNPHHTISGNPSRFETGEVQLVADAEWQTAMPARTKALVAGLTWPLLLRYGYPISA